MAEEFRVKVGIEFDPASSASFKSSVESSLKNTFVPVKIKLDQSSLVSVKNEIKDLGKGIKIETKGKDLLPITSADINRITEAFETMAGALTNIRDALGTIDGKSDFKNIITSVNEAKTSVSGLITEVGKLKGSLDNANFTFSVNMGGNDSPIARNAKYGNQARETIKDLKKQALELEEIFKELYNSNDGLQSVLKASSGTGLITNDTFELLGKIGDKKASLKDQMNTYREYISLMKEIANAKGIDLSSVTSGFTKSADEMIKDTEKILTGEQELEESTNKLKNIFGNGLSVEGLTSEVDRIIKKIGELKTAIESISQGFKADGLGTSLKSISESLSTILQNGLKLQNDLKATFEGVSSSASTSARDVKQVADALNNVEHAGSKINPIEDMESGIESSANHIIEDIEKIEDTIDDLNNRRHSLLDDDGDDYENLFDDELLLLDDDDILEVAEELEREREALEKVTEAKREDVEVSEQLSKLLNRMGLNENLESVSDDVEHVRELDEEVTKVINALELLSENNKMIKFDNVQNASKNWDTLSEEIRQALQQLRLFDEEGKKIGSFTEQGMKAYVTALSDKYAIIQRNPLTYESRDDEEYYDYGLKGVKYIDALIAKEQEAYEKGIQISRILTTLSTKTGNGDSVLYEIQELGSGQQLHLVSRGMSDLGNYMSECELIAKATDEQFIKLYQDALALNEMGFKLDLSSGNILFDEEKGFTLIDLELRAIGEEAQKDEEILNGLYKSFMGVDQVNEFVAGVNSHMDDDNLQRLTSMMSVAERLKSVYGSIGKNKYLDSLIDAYTRLKQSLESVAQTSETTKEKLQSVGENNNDAYTPVEGIKEATQALDEEAEAAERARENSEKLKNELIKVFQAKDAGNAGDSFTEQQFDNMADYVSSLMTEIKSVQGYLNDQGKLVIKVEGVDEAKNAITVVREFETAIQGNQVIKELEGWEVKIKSTFRTSSDEVAEQTKILETNLKNTANQIARLKQELEKAEEFDSAKNPTGAVSNEVQEAKRQLTSLQETYDKLLNDINAGNVSPQVFNELKRISEEAESKVSLLQSKFADEQMSQKANNDFKELESTAERIVSLKEKIGTLELKEGSSNVIAFYKSQLEELEITYSRLFESFGSQFPNFDEAKVGKIKSLFTEIESAIGEAKAKMQDFNESIAKKSVDNFDNFTTKNQFDKIKESFDKLKSATPETIAEFDKLKSSYENLCVAIQEYKNIIADDKSTTEQKVNAVNKLVEANNAYKNSVEATSNIISIDSRTQKQNEERVKSSEDAFKKMLSISNGIKNIKLEIEGLKIKGGGEREIQVLEKELSELESVYEKVTNGFKLSDLANGTNIDFSQLVTLQNNLDGVGTSFDKLKAKMLDTKEKLATTIISEASMSTNANKFDAITLSLSKLDKQSDDTRQSFNALEADYQKLLTAVNNYNAVNKVTQQVLNNSKSSDTAKKKALDMQVNAYDKLINANKNYQESLKTSKNYIDIDTRAMKERQAQMKAEAEARTLALDKSKFASEIDAWATKNSAAISQFGDRIADIKYQIASADGVELNNLKTQFKTLTNEATTAGVATRSFADSFKNSLSRLTTYFSGMMLIMRGISTVKEMFNNVKEVDTSMTELYRITDLSNGQYEKLFSNMTRSAKEYGTALSEIINSTASWVRLGFDTGDANRLAEITAMYQHVTDLDETTAVNNLVTAYKGFQDQLMELNNGSATDAIEMVADIYDKLGNEFAESAADVGDGLSKSASVLAQGGASIQEAAGMFTGMQETLQDSSVSGAALKILTLRIRGMKGELEELGEEVDEDVDSISKMQTQILNWTHGKVNIFDDEGNFRNIYNIMDDIAGVYKELNDQDQASLLEGIAGKNRANAVQAMLNNWENVKKATEAAYNSAGTAQKEQDTWAKSMDAHLQKLHSSWEVLSTDFLDTGFLNGLIDIGKTFVDVFDGIINLSGKFQNAITKSLTGTTNSFSKMSGTISTIASAIAGGFALKGSPMFNIGEMFGKSKINTSSIFPNLEASVKNDITALNNYVSELEKIKTSSSAFDEAKQRAMAFDKTMKDASVTAQTYARQNVYTAESAERLSKDIATSAIQVQAQDKSFKNVRAIIDRYNQGFEGAVVTQQEFVESISKGNATLGSYLAGLGGAEADVNAYKASLLAAKLETIGLQAATVALNMAITMGISIAITSLISLFNGLVHAKKNASQVASDMAKESKQEAESAIEEAKSITELINKYKELAQQDTGDVETRSEIQSIQSQIADLVGNQADNLDLVNGKLDDELKKLLEIQKLESEKAIESANSAYNNSKDNANKAIGQNSYMWTDGYEYYGKSKYSNSQLRNALGNYAQAITVTNAWGGKGVNLTNAENTLKLFDIDVSTAESKVDVLQEMIDRMKTLDGYSEDAFYNGLIKARDYYQGLVDEQTSALDNLIEATAMAKTYDDTLSQITVDSAETFAEYRDKFINIISEDDNIKNKIQSGEISKEQIQGYVDNWMASMPDFSEAYNLWKQEQDKATQEVVEFASDKNQQIIDAITNSFSGKKKLPKDTWIELGDYVDAYRKTVEEFKEVTKGTPNIDPSTHLFGNIDLNDRGVIKWTEDKLKEYKDVLAEYAEEAYNFDLSKGKINTPFTEHFTKGSYFKKYIDDLKGSLSTVLGGAETFSVANVPVDIAFSPMLQTGNGNAELLSPSSVDEYIGSLVDKAVDNLKLETKTTPEILASVFDTKEFGKELFRLDAEGLEVDGKKIKGLIADVGKTAIKTSEQMHFLGTDGALNLEFKRLEEEAKKFKLTAKDALSFVENDDSVNEEIDKVIESYNKLDTLSKEKLYIEYGFDTDDTQRWDLTKFMEDVESLGECGLTTSEQMSVLNETLGDVGTDGSLSAYVKDYTEKIKALQDASQKLDLGSLTTDEKVKLAIDYPELAGAIGNVDDLRNAINELIDTSNQDMGDYLQSEIDRLRETAPMAADALQVLKDQLDALSSDFNFNIDDEITKFENLYTAMKNSVSGTGLKAQDIKNVEAMFSGLKGYDHSALFERTANGIHMNTKELRNLQAQYKENKLNELNAEIETSIDEYNRLGQELSTTSDAMERAGKIKQMEGLKQHIQDVADLASEYVGLTSAYNAWQQAQSAGEEGDMYDAMRDGLEDAKEAYENGLTGTNAFRTYVDLLSSKDLSNAGAGEAAKEWERLGQTIQGTSYKATDFLAEGSDGVLNFLNAVQQLNTDWAKMNDDGSWNINFGMGNDKEIADKLGIDVEFVQATLRKLSDYDFEINLDSPLTGLEDLKGYASDAVLKLNELRNAGKIDFDIPEIDLQANSENVDTELSKVRGLLENYRNEDGTLNLKQEGGQEVETILMSLMTQKQMFEMPSILTVDTSSATEEMQSAISLLSELQTNYNDLQIQTEIGADTSQAQSNIQSIIQEINDIQDKDIRAALNLDDEAFQSAMSAVTDSKYDISANVNVEDSAINTVIDKISKIDANVVTKFTTETSEVDKESAETDGGKRTVTYNAETSEIDRVNAVTDGGNRTVTYKPYTSLLPNSFDVIYRDVVYRKTGDSPSNGTANAFGIGYATGTAFAKGNWGTSKSGVALGGEVAPELVVRDGKFFTVGDNGAEFFSYKKDDIIFNAGQTAQIFKYGRIKNGKKRGEVFAQGNAFAEGTAFSSGSGTIKKGGTTVTTTTTTTTKTTSTSSTPKSSSGSSSSKSSSSSSSKESEKDFDWIEIAINRIERAINNLDTKAKRTFASWSSRTKNLRSEISKITEEISLQNSAYDAYMRQANSVGLSSTYISKIQNGSMDVSTITDDNLADKISKYQQWYEKALDCKDAILDLENTEAELYKTLFDNVVKEYETYISVIEHSKSMIEEFISQSEERGNLVSIKYYDALIKQEQDNIKKLGKERDALYNSLVEAVVNGNIKEESEDWYEMCNQINEVSLSIEQANTNIIEFNNSIRQLNWDIFDMIEDRISNIADEADFLIDLIKHEKLFEENGAFTDNGEAVVGLHAVNYNTYMAQADEYAKEILKIKKQIADNPDDLKLQERYQELIELQQESILAAEEEKEAMVDLVSEGIEKELNSLKELITTYTDMLDAQKDLYDYQKKVKSQTKEIVSLQKQLSAYANDTSEETKTKVQQLKVSLEEAEENLRETEYEKYISDQKKLLDDLYDEYEDILNQRLDNVDALIKDLIESVNQSSSDIANTIKENADSVGYTLTDAMNAVWSADGSATSIVAQYSHDYTETLTSVNTTISQIKNAVYKLANIQDEKATETIKKASEEEATNVAKQKVEEAKANATTAPTPSKTTPTNTVTDELLWGIAKAIWIFNGDGSGWGNDPVRTQRLTQKVGATGASKVRSYLNSSTNQAKMVKEWYDAGKPSLSKYRYGAFKTGARRIGKDQLAWTQEGMETEYIVRPSDGAILTPLASNDSVLNAKASGNIWNMANDPSKFILDSLKISDIGGTVSSNVSSDTYNNDVSMTINLPNVMSYEQFKYALQHDPKFEKMVQSMTVDKMFGGSSLKKYKF